MADYITLVPSQPPPPLEESHLEMREAMVTQLSQTIERVQSGLTRALMITEMFDGDPQAYSTLFTYEHIVPLQMIGYLEMMKSGIVNELLYDNDDIDDE